MNIKSARFLSSATDPMHYPSDDLPEILFVGRSNVGKSSFLNTVLGRKNLAYTSSKPGRTQTLNFYLVNDAIRFVDVPGYGYAKVSKAEREAFATMIDTYLTTREQLELVIQLVDARHEPSKDDRVMLDYLRSYGIPTIVIATKVDKVPVTRRLAREKEIRQALDLEPGECLTFSATEHIHLDLVHDLIEQVLEATS